MKVVPARAMFIKERISHAVLLSEEDVVNLLNVDTQISLETQDGVSDLAMVNGAFFDNGDGLMILLEIRNKQNLFYFTRLAPNVKKFLAGC